MVTFKQLSSFYPSKEIQNGMMLAKNWFCLRLDSFGQKVFSQTSTSLNLEMSQMEFNIFMIKTSMKTKESNYFKTKV